MASTQVEGEFGWLQEKYSLDEEKELGELHKNITRPPPPPPILAAYSNFFA